MLLPWTEQQAKDFVYFLECEGVYVREIHVSMKGEYTFKVYKPEEANLPKLMTEFERQYQPNSQW